MAYSFFPNDFNNVPNLQDQLFLMKQKQDAQRLLEAKRKTEDVIIDDAERDEGEYTPTLQGRLAKGKGKKRGRQVDVEPGRAIPGVSKETEIHHAIELADDDADKNNIYTTGRPLKVRKSEIRRVVETADSTPDNFDGPDAGSQGSSAEVAASAQAMHDALVHTAALSWGYTHPHLRGTNEQTPHSRSMYHIIDTLNAHPSAPFKTAEEVVGAMKPFAIEGNSSLKDHTQEQMGLNSGFSGLMDRDDYEDHVTDAEDEAAATLAKNVTMHVNNGNIFKAGPHR